MIVDITKKYRTRQGDEVRLYEIVDQEISPVMGAYLKDSGDWQAMSWDLDGVFFKEIPVSGLDLLEVEDEKTV